MLRGKQKRFLRSQAHHLRPTFQVGKDGVDATWLAGVKASLDKNELIKIALLQNAEVTSAEVAEYIEANSNIQVVQTIGHTLVLYQQASQPKNRRLSVQVKELA